MAPGERYDIEFDANNPGIWMVHCHIENHADNGMMTLLEYEGSVPPGPLGEQWNTEDGKTVPMHSPEMPGGMDMSMDHGATTNDPDATPQPSVEPAATSSAGEPNAPLATSAAGASDAPVSTAEAGEPQPTMSPSDPKDVVVTDQGTIVTLVDNRFAPKEIDSQGRHATDLRQRRRQLAQRGRGEWTDKRRPTGRGRVVHRRHRRAGDLQPDLQAPPTPGNDRQVDRDRMTGNAAHAVARGLRALRSRPGR